MGRIQFKPKSFTIAQKSEVGFYHDVNVSWQNIWTTNDLYFAKIHVSKYKIKI
jgi:murein L,D-transpeptidase YafK